MAKNNFQPKVTFKKRFKEFNKRFKQFHHWFLTACINAIEFLVFVRLLIN